MKGIAQDFVKYVMHGQVAITEQVPSEAERAQRAVLGADRSVRGRRHHGGRGRGRRRRSSGAEVPADLVEPDMPVVNTPVVKTEWEKTGRNDPCPCGSGKKFKLCHGA